MLKLFGCLCVIAACVGLGRLKADRPEKSRRLLQGAGLGLLALMREMEYALPMSRALKEAAGSAGTAAEIFLGAGANMTAADGVTAEEAWRKAVSISPIAKEDKALLLPAGDGLGAGDIDSQLRSLELARLRLAEAEQKAGEESARYGRVWRTMGWSCGAVLALLLL